MEKYLLASLKESKKIPKSLLASGMFIDATRGLVLPKVQNLSDEELVDIVSKVFPDLTKFSETFHKSWEVIKNTTQEALWAEAIIHYFTTYGLESLGIDNEEFIYIPDEIDCTPEMRKFRVVGIIDDTELCHQVLDTLDSGIALKQDTINNYLTIIEYHNIELDTDSIKNKEVRTLLQYKGKYVPKNGANFARVLHYALTKKTTLVKNKEMFRDIKHLWSMTDDDRSYVGILLTEGKETAASVFFRYKPLFLAVRYQGFKQEVNKIRRLANRLWKPLEDREFLSTKIISDKSVKPEDLEELGLYDLVKVYNKLNYVLKSVDQMNVYYDVMVIRNGKVFVDTKPKNLTKLQYASAVVARDFIKNILRERLESNGINFVIVPDNLEIAFPSSEKSFIGDLPLYSQAFVDKSSVVGIAWEKEDLDLSALLPDGGKVGWNSHYSNQTKDILYSGDMTRGGAEALFFKNDNSALIMLNVYYGDIKDVDLFISNEEEFNLGDQDRGYLAKRYIYDPNNIIYTTKLGIDGKSQVLGVYSKQCDRTVFTFANLGMGDSNVSYNSDTARILIDVLQLRGDSSLKISDIYEIYTQEDYDAMLEEKQNYVEEADLEQWTEDMANATVNLTEVNRLSVLDLTRDLPK